MGRNGAFAGGRYACGIAALPGSETGAACGCLFTGETVAAADKAGEIPQLHMKNSARCRVNDSIEIENRKQRFCSLVQVSALWKRNTGKLRSRAFMWKERWGSVFCI